ncbi:uncharacterized protein RMCFA_3814 [Mycolicibacterium fortuitum subsp. acetamidolyticum]|uniref:Uncharacterized protein n=1 Tax=Mycolicibacterium fortuitum subsp. acetamidolyticum TaxID=144550 RepID=A0A100WSJ8_MYCFO|nr:uncharacterized protein RMCFA_3814 [Mycolicibacterium fortuitum subsp. acetamidolyticum]
MSQVLSTSAEGSAASAPFTDALTDGFPVGVTGAPPVAVEHAESATAAAATAAIANPFRLLMRSIIPDLTKRTADARVTSPD